MESLARQVHYLSQPKLDTLARAKESFQRALLSLSDSIVVNGDNDSDSTASKSEYGRSVSLGDSSSGVGDGSPRRVTFSKVSKHISRKRGTSDLSQDVINGSDDTVESTETTHINVISKARTPIISNQFQTSPRRPTLSLKNPPSPSSPPNSIALTRWQEQVQDFAETLHKHILFTDRLIEEAAAKQVVRQIPSRTLVSDEEDDEMRSMELHVRIASLRNRNWSRERFDPRRYQDLCDAALAEL